MRNGLISVRPPVEGGECWGLQVAGTELVQWLDLPIFELDGRRLNGRLSQVRVDPTVEPLPNGVSQYTVSGYVDGDSSLVLDLILQIAPESPVIRFRYCLRSGGDRVMTKGAGGLRYLRTSLAALPTLAELRLSEFHESVHAYLPTERLIDQRHFENELESIGPIVYGSDDCIALLLAYEHGAMVPDSFLRYRCAPDQTISLDAAKGNYPDGRDLDDAHPYHTVWLHAALMEGTPAELASAYRRFILKHQCPHGASRQPYIYYNTWAYQERNKWWNGQTYLASMHQAHILAEIDVAHRMGVDVFVLDTGWYGRTGEWTVNPERFPDFAAVRARLDAHGMKLGLWFEPRSVAISTQTHAAYRDCLMSHGGKTWDPHPVWETENAQPMCLVSRYADAFADELIRLHRELGVSYFKWDGIGQYGCDSPDHHHGDRSNSAAERADCYAFELPLAMVRIVERLQRACPTAIVDFDVTEDRRAVGLAFLSVGKYFLINNGPYYPNYDIPAAIAPPFTNIFVYPGPARARVCRTPLAYDTWIPSTLFLTHYLPDPPAASQMLNIASLILGQNGIWGDILSLDDDGIARFGRILAAYKQVRQDITEATPVRSGHIGGSPEIHEKIAAGTGRGAVVLFAAQPGTYTYVTAHHVNPATWQSHHVTVTLDGRGRAHIQAHFPTPGAAVILFGIETPV